MILIAWGIVKCYVKQSSEESNPNTCNYCKEDVEERHARNMEKDNKVKAEALRKIPADVKIKGFMGGLGIYGLYSYCSKRRRR